MGDEEQPIYEVRINKQTIVLVFSLLMFGALMFGLGAYFEEGMAANRAEKFVYENCIDQGKPSIEEYEKWVIAYDE